MGCRHPIGRFKVSGDGGCCRQCEYFSDDFGRSNNDNLGDDWSEVAGAWSILSNQLVTSSSNALCVCQQPEPDGDVALVVEVSVTLKTNNDQTRVIVGYQDTTNYYYVQLQSGVTNGVKIFRRVAGIDTQISTNRIRGINNNTPYLVRVCATTSAVAAYVDSYPYAGYSESVPVGLAGIGTGSIGAPGVVFDDFTLSRHRSIMDGCPWCPSTCVFCSDDVPGSLLVHIEGFSNSDCNHCVDMNGNFVLIPTTTNCEYRYLFDWECQKDCGGGMSVTINSITATIYAGIDGTRGARVTIGGYGSPAERVVLYDWESLIANPLDCMTITDEVLQLSAVLNGQVCGPPYQCGPPQTILVTALP